MFAIISPNRLVLMDRYFGLKLPPLKGAFPSGVMGIFVFMGDRENPLTRMRRRG